MSYKWELRTADDVEIATAPYREILAALERPRHRQMLEMLIEHIRCVVVRDLDGIMATLSDDPHFVMWGPKGDVGSKGYEATRTKYANSGFARSMKNQYVTIERYVIDDDTLALELTSTQLLPWQLAKAQGYAIEEESGQYAVHRRSAFFVPFDEEGRERGENSYGYAWPPYERDCERVPDEDVSPEYREWLQALVTE